MGHSITRAAAAIAATVALIAAVAYGSSPLDTMNESLAGCACRTDVDNFCLFGPTDGCAMTQPGGYCDPDGDGDFRDAEWVRGWTEFHAECSTPPPANDCPCRADGDNLCSYGISVTGCAMTFPGGYCDPNGDGNFADGDWVRGWTEYRAICAATPPPVDDCPCRPGGDNLCNYGVDVAGCPMTAPGGYCDPNGDGNFADGDWVRGWTEYRAICAGTPPVATPVPTPTPSSEVRPRRIGIEGPVCLYYDQRSTAWGVRQGARIINNGTATERIVMQVYALAHEPRFGDPIDGTLIATGFFGSALPPHFAFSGQFSFHHDVPQPPPPTSDVLVVVVVSLDAPDGPDYTDFLSFGRIADGFKPPTHTDCVTASATRAP